MKKATIKWITSSENGKKTFPNIGEKYYPMVKFKGQEKIFDWSFIVINLKTINNLTTVSQVSFLMDNAPNDILVKNLEFSLYEGNKLVATGIIN